MRPLWGRFCLSSNIFYEHVIPLGLFANWKDMIEFNAGKTFLDKVRSRRLHPQKKAPQFCEAFCFKYVV